LDETTVVATAKRVLLDTNQLQLQLGWVQTVTMLEFRQNAEGILRRVARGERLLLSHRGRPAARLEPLNSVVSRDPEQDPFLNIARRAQPSPLGKTVHSEIDQILYGRQ
jgi:prevent-host-death family protein